MVVEPEWFEDAAHDQEQNKEAVTGSNKTVDQPLTPVKAFDISKTQRGEMDEKQTGDVGEPVTGDDTRGEKPGR